MLTEQFLNMCVTLCVSEQKMVNESLIYDIQGIQQKYEANDNDIPIEINQKFLLVKTLVDLRLAGKTVDSMVDSISNGNFKDTIDFISLKIKSPPDELVLEDYIKQVRLKKKYVSILKDYDKLAKFVEDVDGNTFESLDETIKSYDEMLTDMYSTLSDEKRKDSISKIASLSLRNDSYNDVFEQIEINYSGDNTVPTGYTELDKLMRKGYDPGRLYVWGGASGDGKSAFLINNIKHAVEKDKQDPDGLINVYGYVSLENLVDESLLRLYSSWSDKEVDKVLDNIKTEKKVAEKFLRKKMKNFNADVDIQYRAPSTFTVFDLRTYIQSLKDQYKGIGRVRAIYVDYLDLLMSGKTFDLYRLELGQIALLLKVVAVSENIPLITVTQLNREGYDKESFSLTQMSESIKKVEHADLVGLLKAQEEDPQNKTRFKDIEIYIGKNRCGPKDKKVTLRADFSKFVIEDGVKATGMDFQLYQKNDPSGGFM